MIETTGRPPSVCGAVAWIEIRAKIFSTLFFIEEIQMKNADFDVNVSTKSLKKIVMFFFGRALKPGGGWAY